MKFSKTLLTIFAALLFSITLFPTETFACACCANPGTYWITTRKPDKRDLDLLSQMKFKNAKIFSTDADDDVKGLDWKGEDFTVSGLLSGKSWKLDFKGAENTSGVLNLTAPLSMVSFMVDTREKKQGDPNLYKEMRFKYRVASGTGMFKKGFAPGTEYFLVLQGGGNYCTDASSFTDWRIEITGKKAQYAFYGELDN